jgi:large subunit ribosomal protein L25
VGEPIGVRDTQGILEMVLREIQVSCLPANIPEDIKADVSNLAIGDVLTVGELVVPEGVRVLTDKAQAVATVAPPAAEEVAAPVAAVVGAVAAAPAEPEVLTERKPKEEAEVEDKDKKGKKKE